MKLQEFEYWERTGSGDEWQIERLVFGGFNLVVGRNATGKTRLLNAIARVAAELSGERKKSAREIRFQLVTADGESRSSQQEWATRTQYWPFAARMNLKVRAANGTAARLELTEAFLRGQEQFGASFEQQVLSALNTIGYSIESLLGGSSAAEVLQVKESNRRTATALRRLSQGQQRVLTLVIYLTYLIFEKSQATILIDDFAEGLDFERARRAAEYLLECGSRSELQFIVATNDRYVMNAVPLELWTLLVEKGDTTQVVNYTNSRNRFDDFKFTGLNHFDFFSMDFASPEE